MSMCIQHCWLYGSIMRGSRNFCQGEGGGSEKNSDNVFKASAFLPFYRGESMVYFKENYILRFQRAPTFYRGGGPNFFRGGGQMLI